MAKFCNGKDCDASTMQANGFEDGLCDRCWEEQGGAERIRMILTTAYAGGVKCNVYINGVEHIIENTELIRVIEKAMREGGYTTDKSSRQKYPRVYIND